ncbi:MAG TPA: hypothetical protein VNK23_17920 [Candidatus Dormibacteraeota bacterium]|nr:hypothetical protein [Candidatus Dormibacteraeota bacterium]
MIVLGKIVLGMAGLGLAGAGVLCSEGLVEVHVVENEPLGHHIRIDAPAILAPIAVRLAPSRDLAQAACAIQPYMPAIRAGLAGLRDSGDVVLVEVNQPGKHVQVSKLGRAIVVDVGDAGETVHLSVPLRAISNTIEELAATSSDTVLQKGT